MISVQEGLDRGFLWVTRPQTVKFFIVVSVFFVVGALSWVGFNQYRTNRERHAQQALNEVISLFKGINPGTSAQAVLSWQELELASRMGYEQNSGSVIAPYFLALAAHALVQQDKKAEALELITRVVNQLAESNSLRDAYRVTQALLIFDTAPERVSEGRDILKSIASAEHSYYKDQALYWLGVDAELMGDTSQARTYFDQLRSFRRRDLPQEYPSPWASLVWSA